MIDGKVFVTRQVASEVVDLLRREFDAVDVWQGPLPPTPQELREGAQGCVALITMLTDRVDAELLEAVPDLKVVANVATGHDNFDLAAASARGVRLANTPGVLEKTTADMAFALLLAVARRVVEASQEAKAGAWGPWHPLHWLGWDVHERTLGVVGLGRIGLEVAKRAKGFDMRVLYTARTRHLQEEVRHGLEYVPSLTPLLREVDFVTLHVPLTTETRGLIGGEELRAMKPTAILINTSRGEAVDQEALLDALRQGTIAGAGLDVTTPEPLPPSHALWGLPNVVITPHIGSATHDTRRRMALLAAENVIAACKGVEMPTGLDLGVVGRPPADG